MGIPFHSDLFLISSKFQGCHGPGLCGVEGVIKSICELQEYRGHREEAPSIYNALFPLTVFAPVSYHYDNNIE